MVPGLTTMFLPITLPEIEKPTPNTSPWLPEILIGPGYLFYHSCPQAGQYLSTNGLFI